MRIVESLQLLGCDLLHLSILELMPSDDMYTYVIYLMLYDIHH